MFLTVGEPVYELSKWPEYSKGDCEFFSVSRKLDSSEIIFLVTLLLLWDDFLYYLAPFLLKPWAFLLPLFGDSLVVKIEEVLPELLLFV